MPILKTFNSLCSTKEFHWHLTKYEARDLLLEMKENKDEKIVELASEVCDNFYDSSLMMVESDFTIEIESVLNEHPSK